MYIKRGVLYFLSVFSRLFSLIGRVYRGTIGVRIYKIGISAHRATSRWSLRTHGRFFSFFGARTVLQAVLLVVGGVVMIPHSVLYSKEENTGALPGRQTVLYSLVGPGDQNFELEEVVGDINTIPAGNTRSWAQGAVSADALAGRPLVSNMDQLDQVNAGSYGLAKPTIISGATLPDQGTQVQTSDRAEIIRHTVQPGEVIGSIAQSYGISVATILWANGLSVRSYIRPGDTLIILPTDGVLHTVKSGDTVSKIARLYGGEESKIIAYNTLAAGGSSLSVGQQLIVPGGEKTQTVSQTVAQNVTESTRKYTALSNVAAPPPSVAAPAGSGYIWPTTVRRITQYYGLKHTGVDIAGPIGTPLYASKSGTVIKSQCGYNGGYGCYIIVDHGNGVQTLYAHASQLYVSVGEQVIQGQTIALMGSTGRSTGPHIHFEVRVNGKRTNPFSYVK